MAREVESFEDGADELPSWQRAVPLVLAILLASALGLFVFLADRASEQRDRELALQRHSFQVIALASDLRGSIANAEALLGRYVVSLEAPYGQQFQDEWHNVQSALTTLERETRDSRAQHANIAKLKAAIAERGKVLNDIALRTAYDQKLGALARFNLARKQPAIPRMHNALARITDYEERELTRLNLLVGRSEMRISRFNDSYMLVGLGMLTFALMAVWFAYGAISERRFARRLAASEAARVDGLEIAVRERTEELQSANLQLRREMEERAQAEQSVRQLQKMEAIGKLTGGIAHDFNNMLAVVVSGIELAKQSIRTDTARVRRHLDSAMEGATRAAALTGRLLAYARPEAPMASQVDADAVVLGMRDLIARATDEGIAVQFDLDAAGWHLWVEQAQLENALLNLVINARDAMEGSGSLTIATRRMTLSQNEIGHAAAGDYVCLSVADTGCGMTPEVIERAFEPFFSTKPVGRGTGLGLSLIFSFVRHAEGAIDVDSTPGMGTTIRIMLPRDEGLARRQPAPDRGESSIPSGLEMAEARDIAVPEDASADAGAADARLVLVVEDDPRVLRSTLDALKALGHRGLSCDHPRKAAALLARHPETALILSDVLMPDMTGPEMIAALGEAATARPVVFVTGFAGEGERAAAQLTGAAILRKPYTLVQLGRTIDEALGESARPPHPAASAG